VKVYVDTNVLASAFATRGLCADVVRFVLAEHDFVTGEVNLQELRRVLDKRFHVPLRIVDEVEGLLRSYEVVPVPDDLPDIKVRDADDLKVLASAMAAEADVLVTGDKDLLDVAAESPIRIVAPRGFWDMVRRRKR
jgi:putative PIN family toxin of toxin-antitoxin system